MRRRLRAGPGASRFPASSGRGLLCVSPVYLLLSDGKVVGGVSPALGAVSVVPGQLEEHCGHPHEDEVLPEPPRTAGGPVWTVCSCVWPLAPYPHLVSCGLSHFRASGTGSPPCRLNASPAPGAAARPRGVFPLDPLTWACNDAGRPQSARGFPCRPERGAVMVVFIPLCGDAGLEILPRCRVGPVQLPPAGTGPLFERDSGWMLPTGVWLCIIRPGPAACLGELCTGIPLGVVPHRSSQSSSPSEKRDW